MREFRPDRDMLLTVVIFTEGLLLLIGTLWCYVGNIMLAPVLVPHWQDFAIGAAMGVALVITSIAIYGISHLLEKVLSKSQAGSILSMKEIAIHELAPFFKNSTLPDIVIISLVSGFCEEVFFRGAIQLEFNLWIAAFIFGMFHMPTFRYLAYGIWAMTAGVLFGVAMQATHSLWTPITAHVLNNLLVILFLRYGPVEKLGSQIDSSSPSNKNPGPGADKNQDLSDGKADQ